MHRCSVRWFDRGQSPGAEAALLGTHYPADPALYHRASPITYAQGRLPPALIIYRSQDQVVHPRQGVLGLAAWRAAGSPAELKIFPNIGHGVEGYNRTERQALLEAAAHFVASHEAS